MKRLSIKSCKSGKPGHARLFVLALVVVMVAAGCVGGGYSLGYGSGGYAAGVTQGKSAGGPPPWAPAHGRRAKHSYSYYPSSGVYFSAAQGLYFYLGSDGSWRAGARLPVSVSLGGGAVTLEMDSLKPYTYHSDVMKRYPPGQQKKSGKQRGKGQGKGKQRGY